MVQCIQLLLRNTFFAVQIPYGLRLSCHIGEKARSVLVYGITPLVPSMQCAAVTISSSLFAAAVPLITVAVQLRLSTPSASKVSLPTVGYPSDAAVAGLARAPGC